MQGLLTLWKGALGSAVLWGLSFAGEVLLSDIFALPRYTFYLSKICFLIFIPDIGYPVKHRVISGIT